MKLYDPIMVVGTGRSGTSMIAGILYHLSVFMGHKFVKADENNSYEHWEDREFHDANIALKSGEINEVEWQIRIEKALIDRKAMMRQWGFKDPRTAELLHLYLPYFRKAKYVWCKRNEKNTIESMKKAYKWSENQAIKLINYRTKCLERGLTNQDVLTIYFEKLIKEPTKYVNIIFNFINRDNLESAIESVIYDDPVAEREDVSAGKMLNIPKQSLN